MNKCLFIIIQVPKKRVSSASESIKGTRKVSPGPKSADSRDQREGQDRAEIRWRICKYRSGECLYNRKE